MLTKGIKQSESYQMFIKYSTCQIPLKKRRGKGSQRKKNADTSEPDVDVSEVSDSEPARKQTSSRRVIKKKVTIFVDDNIIPKPDITLEIVNESVPEPTRRPSGIAFKDTSSVSKKKSPDSSQKLKGPVYKLLKGTCTRSIKLEYNMEECFKELTEKLDWNNSEGDHKPFDLTKPLPLKGHLTVAAEYFFNNDLEYLKSSDLEKKYTTSITKTKTTRFEIIGIEGMVPML
nr:hypothetical protein [Tanacetum cinerariifolium]